MRKELENPFSVTKATEFSDIEINEYWVNFNTQENVSLDAILNPTEFMPKYLIGGKGCGKTHILRYFSYPLQKIRFRGNVRDLLLNDKYLGIYSILNGINSSRFSGKGISEEEWNTVFKYYFELYFCDNLLNTINEILIALEIDPVVERDITHRILSLFNNFKDIDDITTISEVINFLAELRRKIDSQILNAAFTRRLNYEDVQVLFTPGDLLFGIPSEISESIPQLSEVKFIYILDEYEKLFEWQKRFINTLVWDKRTPVTFWIGARRYGYTTRETESGQEMKSGSEFNDINLDTIIRSNEDLYKQFAIQLYTNRLLKYYNSKDITVNPKIVAESFNSRFETYDEKKIIEEIIEKNKTKEYKHLKEFRKKLLVGIQSGQSFELTESSDFDSIIEAIKWQTEDNPLDQKYKLFSFYKKWSKEGKSGKIDIILESINSEFEKYKKGLESEFDEIVDKRKKDMIAQLTRENSIKNTEYAGINEFIRVSQGNARSFILALKKAVEYAKIRGERPLEDGGRISLESQYFAVHDTARWFYEDVELVGERGKNLYTSLKRLSDYFIIERFCDKPVETTVSCFYLNIDGLSPQSISCIELMMMHSILIEDLAGRKEKTSGRKERKFQINKVLAPLWNLPTVIRGSLSLPIEVAESIFNPEIEEKKFQQLYNSRKAQLNAPDFVKMTNGDTEKTAKLF